MRDSLDIFKRIIGRGTSYNSDEVEYVEKCLKAFEIVKTKRVDIGRLTMNVDYKMYNLFSAECQQLEEEEFNLLRELIPLLYKKGR